MGKGEEEWGGKQDFPQEPGALLAFSVLTSSGSSAGKREKVTVDRMRSPEHYIALPVLTGMKRMGDFGERCGQETMRPLLPSPEKQHLSIFKFLGLHV